MKRKKHWYFIETTECALCGHTTVDRERRYTKRPKLWANRHKYNQNICDCKFYM